MSSAPVRLRITTDSKREAEHIRRLVPDAEVRVRSRAGVLDVILLWFAIVGVWPFLPWHFDHWQFTLSAAADITVHIAATVALQHRWRLERR